MRLSLVVLFPFASVKGASQAGGKKYQNGEDVRLGDKVKMWEGCFGVVVFSIDTDEYSMEYPKEAWAYLQSGMMFATDCAGLIHYPNSDEDLELIERASAS